MQKQQWMVIKEAQIWQKSNKQNNFCTKHKENINQALKQDFLQIINKIKSSFFTIEIKIAKQGNDCRLLPIPDRRPMAIMVVEWKMEIFLRQADQPLPQSIAVLSLYHQRKQRPSWTTSKFPGQPETLQVNLSETSGPFDNFWKSRKLQTYSLKHTGIDNESSKDYGIEVELQGGEIK